MRVCEGDGGGMHYHISRALPPLLIGRQHATSARRGAPRRVPLFKQTRRLETPEKERRTRQPYTHTVRLQTERCAHPKNFGQLLPLHALALRLHQLGAWMSEVGMTGANARGRWPSSTCGSRARGRWRGEGSSSPRSPATSPGSCSWTAAATHAPGWLWCSLLAPARHTTPPLTTCSTRPARAPAPTRVRASSQPQRHTLPQYL